MTDEKALAKPDPGITPRDASGRFSGPPANPPFSDPAIAKAAITKRWRDSERDAQAGMLAAAREKGLRVTRPGDAWAAIVEAQSGMALKAKGRASTNAAVFSGKASGYLRDRRETTHLEGDTRDLLFAGVLNLFSKRYPDEPDKSLTEAEAYISRIRDTDENQ